MTFDQFFKMAVEGLVVKCSTVRERRNVLELFEECGFKISIASRKHLQGPAKEDSDITYMHPGFNPVNQQVSCFRSFERAKTEMRHAISYNDIQDTIENPPPLDDRSDTEFANDFASLLC